MEKKPVESRIAEYKNDREYDRTPLMWAIRWNDIEAIEWLLSQMSRAQLNAELKRQDSWGWTPLHIACVGKAELATVKILLDAGADPNLEDFNDATVLMKAVQTANVQLVEFLLQKGANAKHEKGYEALEIARQNGLLAIAQLLEQAGSA